MSTYSLAEFIASGELDTALEHALQHRTAWVEEQLDYETMSEHAENASVFLQQWLPALPPAERLQAADWASTQYILALVHLDHSYGIGAQLLLEAQQAATAYLADSFRSFVTLTDGPDAEIPASVAERLAQYVDQLDAMTFDDH